MCAVVIEPLTLDSLLCDPLTQLVMQSDGVSESEFTALWRRLHAAVGARDGACMAEAAAA